MVFQALLFNTIRNVSTFIIQERNCLTGNNNNPGENPAQLMDFGHYLFSNAFLG